ncbi:MAG: hypothetical protein O4808_06905 [Trichodesmium sp. St17_bin3_1_1]|nr:hypothetical protein [Trichodesmium sp. St17_bin3_1_1]
MVNSWRSRSINVQPIIALVNNWIDKTAQHQSNTNLTASCHPSWSHTSNIR